MPATGVLTGTLKASNVTVATVNGDRARYTSKVPAVAPLVNVPVSLLNPATDKGKHTVIVQAKTPAEQGIGADEFPQGNGWTHDGAQDRYRKSRGQARRWIAVLLRSTVLGK